MLTPQIHAHFDQRVEFLANAPAVATVATGTAGQTANAPAPTVFATELDDFVAEEGLAEEVFGAAGLVIRYADVDSLAAALGRIEGQLTATIHGTESDVEDARVLLPILETRAGRILWGGWPTGVEVSDAMVHGGPYPATSDSRTTSVGTLAIERWQRPVCYQDLPEGLLPEALRDANPWELVRRVDGTLQLP
jgi:NADP-dependent aldehyde dehydrogenase